MIAYGFNARHTTEEWSNEKFHIELKRMWKRINTDEEAGYCIEGQKYQDYYIVICADKTKPVMTSEMSELFFGVQYETEEREYSSYNAAMKWIFELLTRG